ncbi:HlyD family efflux transporter periplasmic adaptor subunit [Oceanispirochaeta crateris]|uniref:HlyD family efflux transporter periplasmic adaptor subunit n=1 Tax=Oceanispirochaeta crateris TaxID=2518645 RepID=A0A5C1QHK4_9SPIO|nr:HlyD family efflux transporter periplasmic adaptor subunit [Oceanispirochaeta crateris]QEN06470.1 HlyD family efflux transporter periplasmic adaptor subunit [Oceanispirochaeta crateris]
MKYTTQALFLIPLLLFSSCQNDETMIDASGSFEAVELFVSSETTGRILELDIQEGDTVEEGSLLGQIDTLQLKLKKEQLEATSDSIKSKKMDIQIQTAPLQQQIQTARKEKTRIENLLKSDAVNTKQLDDINAQLILLERQLEAQKTTLQNGNKGIESELKALESQMSQLEDQINKGRIISPIGGTVLVKYAERGELALPGKSLFKVADLNKMYLRAYITAGQLSLVKLGQSVTVLSDLGEGEYKALTGRITWISEEAEFTPKTVQTRDERANLTYAVKVAVPNDGTLKIGMYGGIRLND